jgi:tetratricopeptide (TPR) repeat protein
MTRFSWVIVVVLVVTALVYAPAATYEFISRDDSIHVYENPHMNPPRLSEAAWYWAHPYQQLYIPVAYSAWTLVAMLAKTGSPDVRGVTLNPYVFHCANILLHLLATLAAYDLLRALFGRRIPAALGAALFALHPLQVEAVAWISGFRDVLCGLLSIVALGQYVRAAQSWDEPGHRSRAWGYAAAAAAAALIAYVLALLSKPAAVTLPLIAGVLDAFVLRRPWKRVALSLSPGILLAIPVVVVAMRVQPVISDVPRPPLYLRPIVAADALGFYLAKLLLPLRLGIDYGRRPDLVLRGGAITMLNVAAALALAFIAIVARRRAPWLIVSLTIAVLALLPVLGLVPFGYQLYSTVADRYAYFALLGPALAVAWWMSKTPEGSPVLVGQTLSSASRRSRESGSGLGPEADKNVCPTESAEADADKDVGPTNEMPPSRTRRAPLALSIVVLALLAIIAHLQVRTWADEVTNYEHGIAVNPDSFTAHNNLAAAYLERSEPDKALQHAAKSAELRPQGAISWFNLGDALSKLERWDQAAAAYRKGLDVQPDDALARVNLAIALGHLGRADEARREFDEAVRKDPSFQRQRLQVEDAIRGHQPQ